MSSSPLVSAVIPSYNHAGYVVEAVESALAQTHRPLEIVVVDDGSTDRTAEVLAPYAADGRIRYVHQANAGLSAARNAGIAHAKGEWIALLDADDLWHPEKTAAQLLCARRHPEAALIAGDPAGSRAALSAPLPAGDPDGPPSRPASLEDLVVRTRFGPASALIRAEALRAAGPFDTALRSAEDRDMWIRIAARHPIRVVSGPLWYNRPLAGSMSRAAEPMERYERQALDKAFATQPSLRGRWALRMRAYARADCIAAYRYADAGRLGLALRRLARSAAGWPWPFAREDWRKPWIRPQLLLRVWRLWRRAGRLAPNAAGDPLG